MKSGPYRIKASGTDAWLGAATLLSFAAYPENLEARQRFIEAVKAARIREGMRRTRSKAPPEWRERLRQLPTRDQNRTIARADTRIGNLRYAALVVEHLKRPIWRDLNPSEVAIEKAAFYVALKSGDKETTDAIIARGFRISRLPTLSEAIKSAAWRTDYSNFKRDRWLPALRVLPFACWRFQHGNRNGRRLIHDAAWVPGCITFMDRFISEWRVLATASPELKTITTRFFLFSCSD